MVRKRSTGLFVKVLLIVSAVFAGIVVTAVGASAAPVKVPALGAATHRNATLLEWSAASGAARYEVRRDGVVLATVTTRSFTDVTTSAGQAYRYAVIAVGADGSRAPEAIIEVQAIVEPGDRAWVSTGAGPALCGRAGSSSNQVLVCTVRSGGGFVRRYSSAPGDWGFASNRAWVPSPGGVDYCALVGSASTDRKVRCTTFTGSAFTPAVTSATTDWGYPEDREWVSSNTGPALCGRAGGGDNQVLVCTVRSGDSFSTHYSGEVGWGLASNRAWVSAAGGVDYCALVTGVPANALRVRCATFTGSGFTPEVTSANTDLGFPDNRTWVSTSSGPALCGRAGSLANRLLTCTVRDGGSFSQHYSAATDWGYGPNRAWVPSTAGVEYCALVGSTNAQRVQCTTFTGSGFSPSVVSDRTDWGYSDNRAWVSTGSGPALCGRAGTTSNQVLTCTTRSGGSFNQAYSSGSEWGLLGSGRSWVPSPSGVDYCSLTGGSTVQRVQCATFNGSTFGTTQVSVPGDWGYADAIPR